jgi:hypothetical protein
MPPSLVSTSIVANERYPVSALALTIAETDAPGSTTPPGGGGNAMTLPTAAQASSLMRDNPYQN